MADSITDTGPAKLAKIAAQVRIFETHSVDVGVVGDRSDVAIWQEFGTSSIPARPFMRRAADQNREAIADAIEDRFGRILDGRLKGLDALRELGAMFVRFVRDQILRSPSWAVPNAPGTIAQKGASHPLIDEGEMLSNVVWRIRKGTTIVETGSPA